MVEGNPLIVCLHWYLPIEHFCFKQQKLKNVIFYDFNLSRIAGENSYRRKSKTYEEIK